MKNIWLVLMSLALAGSVFASEELCAPSEIAQGGSIWLCVLKDGCDKPHEGRATCKTHAEDNAEQACLLNSDEPETCAKGKLKVTCNR